MKGYLLVLFMTVTLAGCNVFNNNSGKDFQKYLFEVQYINYAWGYIHSGFYINKKGEIYQFRYDRDSEQWRSNPDNYYTEEELKDKYSPNHEFVATLEKSDVLAKKELIPTIMESSYSDSVQIGADQGAKRYICYYYDSKKKEYLRIIIEQEGDWSFNKQSAAADSVVNWLKKLDTDF